MSARWCVAIVVVLGLGAAVALAENAGGLAGPAATRRAGEGWSLVEARLPGRLVAAAAVPRAGGGRDLFVLVAPPGGADGVRSLLRIEAPAAGDEVGVTPLRDGLSAGLDALDAIDLDGDGRLELLAGEPRRLHCLGVVDGARGELAGCAVEVPGWIDLRSPDRSRLRAPGASRRWLVTAEAGRARFYAAGATAPGSRWAELASERLPLEVDRQRGGLRLVSPPLSAVDPEGETPSWLAGPLAAGPTRLRLLRLTPRATGGAERNDFWCRLPRPERVEAATVGRIAGEPHLVVATTRTDRFSLLEKLALRVFPLRDDRTRTGRGASFATDTELSRWRRARLELRDTDGDGREDLLAIGARGLRADGLAVTRWAGLGGGRFASEPTSVAIAGGERRAELAADLTGDGTADLLLFDGESVALFAGVVGVAGRGPFEARPRATVAMRPAVPGERRVEVAVGGGGVAARTLDEGGTEFVDLLTTDLDGGGRNVAIVVGEEAGAGVVWVLRFGDLPAARR